MTNREILEQMRSRGRITQEQGWKFFDRLEPVEAAGLHGKWKGSELVSGHPMDGMLAASGWYGKYFASMQEVYPLLFEKGNGELFAADPGLLPLKIAERLPRRVVRLLFSLMTPFIRTKKSGARNEMVLYRGKVTAVMIYDRQPVLDFFARIDENTLLGVSDFKWERGLGYFFVLEYQKE